MHALLSLLAGIIHAVGYYPYIRSIQKHETRPSFISWMIWFLLESTMLWGMFVEHAVNWQIVSAAMGTAIVAALALWNGERRVMRADLLWLALAMLGLVLWIASDNPDAGIATSAFVYFVGYIPTYIHTLQYPHEENTLAWTLWWIAGVIMLCSAMPLHDIRHTAQPAAFFATETVMLLLLYLPRRTCAQ